MAAFTGKTLQFTTETRVAGMPEFIERFIENGMPDYTDVAVSGSTEIIFGARIIDVMVSEKTSTV